LARRIFLKNAGENGEDFGLYLRRDAMLSFNRAILDPYLRDCGVLEMMRWG